MNRLRRAYRPKGVGASSRPNQRFGIWLVPIISLTASGCSTINVGPSPGLPGRSNGGLSLHGGSQWGPVIGDSGAAGEAMLEFRYVGRRGMFGLRTSYLARGVAGDTKESGPGGLAFAVTGGATLQRGIGVYAGLGFIVEGSMVDSLEREGDASGFRALVGGTWWFVADSTFGYGITAELDIIVGSADFPTGPQGYTSLSLVLGLELGFPQLDW